MDAGRTGFVGCRAAAPGCMLLAGIRKTPMGPSPGSSRDPVSRPPGHENPRTSGSPAAGAIDGVQGMFVPPAGADQDIGAARLAVSLTPENPALHVRLGMAYLARGRRALAEASFRRGLSLDPGFDAAREALAGLERIPVADPDEGSGADPPPEGVPAAGPATAPGSVRVEASAGNRLRPSAIPACDERVEACRGAVAESPGDARAWCGLGVALGEAGRVDEALGAFEKAVALQPHDAAALANLGACHLRRGAFAEAFECCRRARDLRPEDSEIAFAVAAALSGLGRHEEARDAFRGVLAKIPGHVRAACGLALALLQLGQPEEARLWFREAIVLAPEDPVPHYFLGLTALAGRHEGEALREYRVLSDLHSELAESLFEAIYPGSP